MGTIYLMNQLAYCRYVIRVKDSRKTYTLYTKSKGKGAALSATAFGYAWTVSNSLVLLCSYSVAWLRRSVLFLRTLAAVIDIAAMQEKRRSGCMLMGDGDGHYLSARSILILVVV